MRALKNPDTKPEREEAIPAAQAAYGKGIVLSLIPSLKKSFFKN